MYYNLLKKCDKFQQLQLNDFQFNIQEHILKFKRDSMEFENVEIKICAIEIHFRGY